MSYFLHSPLSDPESEIRLVVLHPGKKHESVHCDLITVPSISAKSFEALSYCWGQTSVTNTIFVSGKSLQISPNLEKALRHLRKRKSSRSLWIDAICINQKDIPEKNKQVPKMRQIYKLASEVLVWIGRDHEPEDAKLSWNSTIWDDDFTIPGNGTRETTQQAFEFAKSLSNMFRPRPIDRSLDRHFLPILKKRDNYVTLSRLLRRQWFYRLWTIQEVVLAQKCTVLCGFESLPWLFGLMGMTVEGEDIEPDYTQDYKEVYRSWVMRHIVRTQSLDVLSLCADETQHNFPSWVPDLTQRSGCDNAMFYIMHAIRGNSDYTPEMQLYNASGNGKTKARFTETPDPNSTRSLLRPTLCVKAIHIERIIGLTPDLIDGVYNMDQQLPADLQRRMKEIEDRLIAVQNLRSNSIFLSAIYKDFGTTVFRGNSHPLDSISHAQRYERWRGRAGDFDIPPGSREEQLLKTFYKTLQHHLDKTQIVFTESGKFGLVFTNCHVCDRDDIYILEGGKTPFILREDASGQHKLMGSCYLYGAMGGERVFREWDMGPGDSRWGYGLGKMRDINIV